MDEIKKEIDMRVSVIINDKDLHNKMYKNFLLLMEDEKFRESMKDKICLAIGNEFHFVKKLSKQEMINKWHLPY